MASIPTFAARGAFTLRLRNFAASATVVALAAAIYLLAPYNRAQLDALYAIGGFGFTGRAFLTYGAALYAALLGVYYLAERDPVISKSVCFIRVGAIALISPIATFRNGIGSDERLALLATLLKAFFAPLMAVSLMNFCVHALHNASAIAASGVFTNGSLVLFDRYGFWFLLQLVLFVDVLVFTVGYLVEVPNLRNEIRSVDPTLLGWAVALICYPPFNMISKAILGWQVNDFPQFDNPTAHVVLNVALLALMTTYASASVALGFKGSNLTHRGIISRGPYAFVRHPAYVCKNVAWWIGSIPVVSVAFAQSTFTGIEAVASVAGWSMIYILRAMTEEDHLRSVDDEYARYASKVRYRFIPGVI